MSRLLPFACLLCLLGAPAVLRADVLLIERVGARADVTLPQRGSLMSQVEARFGAPERKHPPVGGGSPQQPPITRWDYADFSVYFENNHVVNAVMLRAQPNEKGPKPADRTP